MNTQLWAILLVVIATVFGGFGALFLKKGSEDFSINVLKLIKNYYLILGVFFYALGTILFIPALKGGELSILYPLVSLSYIWVMILSVKLLKEKMNKFKWIGILLVIIGVIFVGLSF